MYSCATSASSPKARAALASACLLGQRFSIIAISNRIQAWYRECVAANGLSSRRASVRSLQQPLRDIGSVQEDHAARLEEMSLQAVREDGADVIDTVMLDHGANDIGAVERIIY